MDLGCGVGWLCFVLVEFGAKEVFGVDCSVAQIAIAQDRAEDQRSPVPDTHPISDLVCNARVLAADEGRGPARRRGQSP
jgi:predicted RNA methylase